MKHLHNIHLSIATAAMAATLFVAPAMLAQNKPGNVLDLKYSIQDSEIVFPESYETDSRKLVERWYLKNYTSADVEGTSQYDPGASESEIKKRLAALPTIIDMPYNSIVLSYIERYTKQGRKQVTALLGLSSYYMPIFEQALEQAGLPLELKYLPVIESGLDPNATSKHGAAGLWQFMIAPARGYDMEVSSLVDERRDPYVSSEKACKMLKDLYETYGDWSLAIAAYNCGPGTVNKALNRAGGDPSTHDFWSIYNYLPSETRGYVPMFIAANYVMTYYPQHGISPVLATKPLVTDTVHLSERVHFEQIAAVLDIPIEELRVLNPQFRADIIPGTPEHPYNLVLPSQQMHAYIVSEAQIRDYERDKYARKIEAEPGGDLTAAVETIAVEEPLNPADPAPAEQAAAEIVYEEVHPQAAAEAPRRRRAETAQATAETQKPAASTVKPEQKTTAAASTASKSTSTASSKKASTPAKKTTPAKPKSHTVASGENLTVIAKKYGVTVAQLKQANPNLKNDMLHPGDKLSLPKGSAAGSSKSSSSKKKRKK